MFVKVLGEFGIAFSDDLDMIGFLCNGFERLVEEELCELIEECLHEVPDAVDCLVVLDLFAWNLVVRRVCSLGLYLALNVAGGGA